MPHNSQKALCRNTHTVWDNPGCPTPQPSTEVSGIRLVDWLDKDNYEGSLAPVSESLVGDHLATCWSCAEAAL